MENKVISVEAIILNNGKRSKKGNPSRLIKKKLMYRGPDGSLCVVSIPGDSGIRGSLASLDYQQIAPGKIRILAVKTLVTGHNDKMLSSLEHIPAPKGIEITKVLAHKILTFSPEACADLKVTTVNNSTKVFMPLGMNISKFTKVNTVSNERSEIKSACTEVGKSTRKEATASEITKLTPVNIATAKNAAKNAVKGLRSQTPVTTPVTPDSTATAPNVITATTTPATTATTATVTTATVTTAVDTTTDTVDVATVGVATTA